MTCNHLYILIDKNHQVSLVETLSNTQVVQDNIGVINTVDILPIETVDQSVIPSDIDIEVLASFESSQQEIDVVAGEVAIEALLSEVLEEKREVSDFEILPIKAIDSLEVRLTSTLC